MKIKTTDMKFSDVIALPIQKHFLPKKPNIFFRTLLKVASFPDLKATNFNCTISSFDKNVPSLILMNHSSFIDLKIASSIFYPKPLNIICTNDGFVGKEWLMRNLGCIPTKKFASDSTLIKDILYSLNKLKTSVLMYPEASYSFDGTATPLPNSLGKLIKKLAVPVTIVHTYGAFLRDPLYNNLQLRKLNVSANVKRLFSIEEIEKLTVDEINEKLKEEFSFDNFKRQKENNIHISEEFRANGLERVLYKCPNCKNEGDMHGNGIHIKCNKCNKEYILDELGQLNAVDSKTEFEDVPTWYQWERESVKTELLKNQYSMDIPVEIKILKDYKSIYNVGDGRLIHNENGFHLISYDGQIDAYQSATASYSLYADFYWYELGDVICIYSNGLQYYCFPKSKAGIVAKARLATEELFKIKKLNKGD